MSQKYIHYFWFGNKPLSKTAKKCIKSWKKVFPDYKIIKWNEDNFNVNDCPFIRDAYKSKKWAFVSDYARTKVLNEMGGLYFDTDMYAKEDLRKSRKFNTWMMVIALIAMLAAIAGPIATIFVSK